MIDLAGKKAVVTGGSSGIGRAIAETLATAGARVCVADLTEQAREGGDSTVARITARGGSAEFVKLDVTASAHVASVFADLDERLDGLDILVNNAGVLREGSVADTDDETWRVQFAVNVDGTFHCTREIVRALRRRERPGKIVNISSISGFRGNPGFAAYCASKGAIVNFTRQVGLDYAGHGINVADMRFDARGVELDRGKLFGGKVRVTDVDVVRVSARISAADIRQATGVDVRLVEGQGTATLADGVIRLSVGGLPVVRIPAPDASLLPCDAELRVDDGSLVAECSSDELPDFIASAVVDV